MKITVHSALGDGAGELAQRLAHEPGLQADVAVAHFAFDFGAGNQGGHRVDDDHVDRVGANEQLADFQRLLAGVGLGDQQIVELDAEPLGPGGIERVLGVDERGHAADLLRVGDDVQRERRFAAGFRPEDFDARGRAERRPRPGRCPD